MSEQSSVCGLILAAGQSSRMGREKALLPWPPTEAIESFTETLLSAAVNALRPHTHAVIVVAGKNANNLVGIVAECGALLATNPEPERGQFSSMQVGLAELVKRGYNGAMITPVDCPPLSATTLALLRAEFDRALSTGRWGVAPESNGRRGHPLLINRAFIEAFLRAPATSNAREVKHMHPQAIEYIPVPDAFVSIDVNTPEQYAALISRGEASID